MARKTFSVTELAPEEVKVLKIHVLQASEKFWRWLLKTSPDGEVMVKVGLRAGLSGEDIPHLSWRPSGSDARAGDFYRMFSAIPSGVNREDWMHWWLVEFVLFIIPVLIGGGYMKGVNYTSDTGGEYSLHINRPPTV